MSRCACDFRGVSRRAFICGNYNLGVSRSFSGDQPTKSCHLWPDIVTTTA
jgi:hypothetical protein